MSTTLKKRYLGGLEFYSQVRNHHDLYTTVLVTATFSKPLNKEGLYAALGQVVAKEPFLRVDIDYDSDEIPYFRPLAKIDLDQTVAFVDDSMSRNLLTSFHSEKFVYANETPLWKIVVMGQKELAFIFDHSCFDGSSGAFILQKLTTALNQNSPALNCNVLTLPVFEVSIEGMKSIIPPPLEELAPTIPSVWRALGIVSGEIFNFIKKELLSFSGYGRDYVFTGAPVPGAVHTNDDSVPVTCKWVGSYDYLDLNEEVSNKMVTLAKTRGVSVTSLLYVILLSALDNEIRKHCPEITLNQEGSKKAKIIGQCPINARRYFKTETINTNEIIGNYVGNATSTMMVDLSGVEAGSEAFWVHALDFQSQLRSQLTIPLNSNTKPSPPSALESIGMLSLIPSVTSYVLSRLGQVRGDSLEISNLGVISKPETNGSEYSVSRLRISQSTGAIGAPYKLTSVTNGKGGALSLVLCVCEDKDSLVVGELINKIDHIIQRLIEKVSVITL
ncbi:hypothetical protein NADFUDRAFT_53001 [Nadsonia fulvescens var. elongata DSM 6958]|uniref:Alcohol acetyltransferase n=1 Tax=Nadsonia fulvescens var. elongata DSM 6958 TaxID=857566 RepID=A0A1E3PF14_9ASCO|nr:hypothetical protein NADFUDRAFT_53001 [Nadsonia fulvescens var. elongata DSM 6958]